MNSTTRERARHDRMGQRPSTGWNWGRVSPRPSIDHRSRAYADPNQRPDSDEVVGRIGEGENPTHFPTAAMTQFAQSTDGLAPPESFFDQFAFDLTHLVSEMARRAMIDGARRTSFMNVLRDVRRRVACANPGHEVGHVIAL